MKSIEGARSLLALAAVAAIPLPDPRIPGFHFPESEATVLGWVYQIGNGNPVSEAPVAFEKLHAHAWGLWTALTSTTSESVARQPLRVFETWVTPEEIASAPLKDGRSQASRSEMRIFRQLHREQRAGMIMDVMRRPSAEQIIGFVKFNPSAAAHIARQDLLSASTLNRLLQGGAQQVSAFPATALAVKAVFLVITTRKLVDGRYFQLKAWTGPPATPQPWGPAQWPGSVWIDTLGGGGGSGAIDMEAASDGGTRTDATTYPVSSLIHYRLDAEQAAQLSQGDAPLAPGAAAGDYAILVAMHVSGREISRWTWQTFWWTPLADDPPAPSSSAIAGLRPSQLQGPARNYAMALAYDMLVPGQPNTRGSNAGYPLYAYNPWLEAGFAPSDLPDSIAGGAPGGGIVTNNVGVQSNCMSCHARANYNPSSISSAPRYSGARYVDLNDPQFAGTLQLDFLWSLSDP